MPKNYSTQSAARAAIKKAGLSLVPHSIELISRTWEPVFYPDLWDDVHYIHSKGFSAVFTPSVNAGGTEVA